MYDRRVDADFAIELGPDDETLEFPWADPDGGLRYYDLRREPELLGEIEEARRVPELGEFLAAVNAPAGLFETAKCDAWLSREINVEEEIFGADLKFGSYVDLVFSDEAPRFSFPAHEGAVKRIVQRLRGAADFPASAQLLVRRCFYGEGAGFYLTLYLFGYGADQDAARKQWGVGLKLAENALRQI